MIEAVDWLPTFAELAGAPLPTRQPVDGASVVPLMQGKPGALTDRAIFWHYPLYLQGSAHGKVIPVHGTEHMYWRATPSSIIRRGEWKLMQFFESGKTELYNIRQDIAEKTDLSTNYPEKAAELLKELQQWQAGTRATIPTKLNPAVPETGKKRGKGKGKKAP